MVDITDPVQTIVSLLKSSSTGIGTTGYEITNDAGTALTISNGDILVSYALSREELKNLFGGSQDYDVIITVRKGEVEDDWIGLSTKQWKVPVIIEVNIIDKWSGAGSNLQTITAVLVREKAENAIRKFIKNKTNAPGGSVHRWLGKTYRDEEDRSLKPIIFKCTITTESWTYYDPPIAEACPTGEQIINGDFELGALTGWGTVGDVSVTGGEAHGGSYKCQADQSDTVEINQDLNDIPVSCFDEESVFKFFFKGSYDGCSDRGTQLTVEIFYTDETETTYEKETTSEENGEWVEIDLKSLLEAGKEINRLEIKWNANSVSTYGQVDDVSLVC